MWVKKSLGPSVSCVVLLLPTQVPDRGGCRQGRLGLLLTRATDFVNLLRCRSDVIRSFVRFVLMTMIWLSTLDSCSG